MSQAPRRQTFREWADAYTASRIDVAEKTKKTIDSYLKVIVATFRDRDPAAIMFADVQEWVVAPGLKAKASSLRQYLSMVRAVLDYAGLTGEANPARDPRPGCRVSSMSSLSRRPPSRSTRSPRTSRSDACG
jgi:hypothetical protein